MNETILDIEADVSENVVSDTESVASDTEYSKNDMESDISDSGSDVGETDTDNAVAENVTESATETESGDSPTVTNVTYAMEYDEELGGYPVVIVNDISDNEVATLSLANGMGGYQISDYWLNYFRGVLQKYGNVDYLAFATREDATTNYNYVTHYYLYIGDIENGGDITVYDCYSESSVYYVDVTTETVDAIDVSSYDTLAYSNLGHMADLRTGVNHVESTALLFFLGFFAVYTVCRDFFNRICRK